MSKPISYRRAKKLYNASYGSKDNDTWAEACKNGLLPEDGFWYTNEFTYELWLNKESKECLAVLHKFSLSDVYDAISSLLRGIDKASRSGGYDNYTPDAMGN